MAHSGTGGLQTHEHAGLGLLSGPIQLVGQGAGLGQLLYDAAHGGEGIFLRVGRKSGVQTDQTGVPVVGEVGVYGVAKAAFLTHLLKQPGGHAAAQQRGQQVDLKAPLIQIGQGGKSEDQVILLRGFALDSDSGLKGGGLKGGFGSGAQDAKTGLEQLNISVGEAACQRDDYALGAVMAVVVGAQAGTVHGGQRLGCTKNGPCQR